MRVLLPLPMLALLLIACAPISVTNIGRSALEVAIDLGGAAATITIDHTTATLSPARSTLSCECERLGAKQGPPADTAALPRGQAMHAGHLGGLMQLIFLDNLCLHGGPAGSRPRPTGPHLGLGSPIEATDEQRLDLLVPASAGPRGG